MAGRQLDHHIEATGAAVALGPRRAEASAGNDIIVAFDGNETLDAFAGNDLLFGGYGADTYIFGRGYHHDTIEENGDTGGTPVIDKVAFKAGLAPSDLQLSRMPLAAARLRIRRRSPSIFDYQYEDFEFMNYQFHPAIRARVAV